MNITEYLVTHAYGTVIWTSLVFFLLFFLLLKFAWKPILTAVQTREEQISQALAVAQFTQEEVKKIKEKNEMMLKEAQQQRDLMLKEAKYHYEQMIADARVKAEKQGKDIIEEARKKVALETKAAVYELKNTVADLALQIAEKILLEKLGSDAEQKKLIQRNLENIQFN
jgi:F-type H+-transporting ATPase subunit b